MVDEWGRRRNQCKRGGALDQQLTYSSNNTSQGKLWAGERLISQWELEVLSDALYRLSVLQFGTTPCIFETGGQVRKEEELVQEGWSLGPAAHPYWSATTAAKATSSILAHALAVTPSAVTKCVHLGRRWGAWNKLLFDFFCLCKYPMKEDL